MLDGGAEPESSPASRAGVGEGKERVWPGKPGAQGGVGQGSYWWWKTGGPGQASGRAASGGGKPEGLLLASRLLLLLTLQGVLGFVQMEGDTASASPCPWSCLGGAQSLQSCPTLCNPVDWSPPGLSVQGLSRQEYGTGCHSLLWGSSCPVMEPQPPASPALAGGLSSTRPSGKPCLGPRRILICVFPKPGLSVAGAEGQACESKTSACG